MTFRCARRSDAHAHDVPVWASVGHVLRPGAQTPRRNFRTRIMGSRVCSETLMRAERSHVDPLFKKQYTHLRSDCDPFRRVRADEGLHAVGCARASVLCFGHARAHPRPRAAPPGTGRGGRVRGRRAVSCHRQATNTPFPQFPASSGTQFTCIYTRLRCLTYGRDISVGNAALRAHIGPAS